MVTKYCKPKSVGLIVCGPCACGKSEIATALANYFQVPFVDADSFHSEENIRKMSNGIPLTDEDRLPWLHTVRQQMILQKKETQNNSPVTVVAACSALKKIYRNILAGGSTVEDNERDLAVIFIFLNCFERVLQERINLRQGHFMKGNMLASQLATLEVPVSEQASGQAIIINGDEEVQEVIREAIEQLKTVI